MIILEAVTGEFIPVKSIYIWIDALLEPGRLDITRKIRMTRTSIMLTRISTMAGVEHQNCGSNTLSSSSSCDQ